MNAILNVDLDFFTKPTYFGSYFGSKDWTSFESFKAAANIWLPAEEFLSKLGITSPIRGSGTTENSNAYYEIKRAYDLGIVEKGKTELVQFDAHPNTYCWHTKGAVDHWKINDFKSFNISIAYFKEKLVDSITWVVPDYMNGEILNKHFENFEILKDRNVIVPVVSSSFTVKLKMIRWSEFIKRSQHYDWKFFTLATNNRMCVYDHDEIQILLKHIKKYS